MPSGKVFAALLIFFLVLTIVGMTVDGSGGVVSTRLNGALTAANLTVTVDSTDGFLTADTIHIDKETITYTGLGGGGTTFTGCTRGAQGTTAAIHAGDTMVYSSDAGILNAALGFNIVSLTAGGGKMAIINLGWNVITVTIPRLVLCDYSVFDRMPFVIIRVVFQLMVTALVIFPLGLSAVMAVLGAFASFFRSL